MPPQSRGVQRPNGFQQSKSSPNLPTVRALAHHERGRLSLDQRERSNGINASPYIGGTLNGDLHSSDDEDISTEEDDNNNNEDVHNSSDEDFPPLNDDERNELYTTRSHPHLPPSSSQLFPPFYNRPPTPLPPSPSLTSLLRPSFSTHNSRHTTPESSDTESATGASTTFPSGLPSSLASKPPSSTTRAHPKVPTYEYYGFALYLASSAFFLMYLLWAYLPSPFLHQLGIYYYPNRWWALAIPCWLVVLVAWIYVALASYNTGYLTLKMGSLECVVDEAGTVAVLDRDGSIIRNRERNKNRFEVKKGGKKSGGGRSRQSSLKETYVPANLGEDVEWRSLWNEGTDAVLDVPIGGVCEILYGEGRERNIHDYEDEFE